MQFLSDVYLRCPDCDGRRYRREVLEVKLLPPGSAARAGGPAARAQARSVADVLDLTVAEACDFFAGYPEVLRAMKPLAAVGLDYLRLGQPVPTLSGGEAQRLKLAGYLAEAKGGGQAGERILFLFDEPTTGLHFDDIAVLLSRLPRAAGRRALGGGDRAQPGRDRRRGLDHRPGPGRRGAGRRAGLRRHSGRGDRRPRQPYRPGPARPTPPGPGNGAGQKHGGLAEFDRPPGAAAATSASSTSCTRASTTCATWTSASRGTPSP